MGLRNPGRIDRITLTAFFATLLLAAGSASAGATSYYVDGGHPLADDENPGTISLPWATIQHGLSVAVAGDSILVRDGIYRESLETVRSGDPANGPITLSAHEDERPILDGTGIGTSVGMRVTHAYLFVRGLEIRDWNTGVWLSGAHDIVIEDCEVHQVSFGIGAANGTHDFELRGVELHHFTLYGFDASPSGGSDCYNGLLLDCVAHTANDLEQNVDGFALGHGGQRGFVFRGCEAYGVYDGFDISASHTVLDRCSAHDCVYRGISGWQDSLSVVNSLLYGNGICNAYLIRGQTGPHHYSFQNCTFMDADTYNIITDSTGAGIALEMTNCVLAGGDNVGLWLEQLEGLTYQGNYNLFHNDNPARAIWAGGVEEFSLDEIEQGAWTAFSGQDGHSLVAYEAEHLFVDPLGYDLHPLAHSPTVDSGTASGAPDHDYDGHPRPLGGGYDQGAYEHQDAGSVDQSPVLGGHGPSCSQRVDLSITPPIAVNEATLAFKLRQPGHVHLALIDPSGRPVARQEAGHWSAGRHQMHWQVPPVPSGRYWVLLSTSAGCAGSRDILLVR